MLGFPDNEYMLGGARIVMSGGTLKVSLQGAADRPQGGDFLVVSNSVVDELQDTNPANDQQTTLGSLAFGPGAPTLTFTNSAGTTPDDIFAFIDSVVTNAWSFDVDDSVLSARLRNTTHYLGNLITKTGNGALDIRDSFAIGMRGSATFAASTNVTLIDCVAGTVTATLPSYQTADGLWSFDIPGDLVASATNLVASVAIDDDPTTFAAEDAGVIEVTEIGGAGLNVTLVLKVTNFAAGSIDDVVAELQRNPEFSKVSKSGANELQLTANASGTSMYFIWDNVVNSLGGDLYGVEALGPSKGTLLLVR
jgi:hypothetical protein